MMGWSIFIIVVLMYAFLIRFVRGADERVSCKEKDTEGKFDSESR